VVIEFGGFRLHPAERALTSPAGEPIQLTRRLYDTLLFMVERPGRLLEKQALLDAVWKGLVVEENTLSRTISNLRQLLGEGEQRYIETVSGAGYRFVQPVRVSRSAEPAPQQPSIAVMTFEDLSRERDQGYFADGIAEEVLNRLAGINGLRVIAKASAFRFRGGESVQAVGRALGVDYLLRGAVRKDGNELRITAQLVDVATESQRWSERFDRALEHVFAIQDDIARAVALALRATLRIDEPAGLETGTRDLAAFDLYLLGRSVAGQSGAHAMIRAPELYREAVRRDPGFAPAWLALAAVSRGRLIFAPQHTAAAILDIEEAVAKLREIAPQWWATHLASSWTLHVRRDWVAVHRALERAKDLAPATPLELEFNDGVFVTQVGDLQAGLERFAGALRRDPLSLMTSGLVQMLLTFVGRHDEADAEYRRSLDLAGDREMVEHLVVHRLWAQGKPFREQLGRYLGLTRTNPAPVLHDVHAVCEEPHLALAKLRAAAAAPENRIPPWQGVLAWWLAAYGDVDAAFDALWRCYVDLGYFNASWLWFPVLARVREHPRFPDLTERIGLAAYWRATGRAPAR
jgi:TolB-like protein